MMESLLSLSMMESLEETVCSVEIGGLPWEETDYTSDYVDFEISSGGVERSRSTVEEMCYTPESVEIDRFPKRKKDTVPKYVRTAGEQSTSKVNNRHPPYHPPYKRMILEAMNAIMERTTCSWPAIAKSIREKYMETLPHDFKKKLSKELRDLTERGVLVRTKNSFKFAHGFKNYDGVDYDDIESGQDEPSRGEKRRRNKSRGYDGVDYDDIESDQDEPGRGEERRRNKPCVSKIFVFKGTVHNPHFH